jgi:hypothetical protein
MTWVAPPPRRDGRPLSRRERVAFARGVDAFYAADDLESLGGAEWQAKADTAEPPRLRWTWWRRLLGR